MIPKLISYIPFNLLLHFEKIGILDPEETNKYILDETGTYFPKLKKMAKYRCMNQRCINFDIIKKEYGTHTKYVGTEAIDVKAYCPECGMTRELIEPNKVQEEL